MQKAVLALMCVCMAALGAENIHAAPNDAGSTTGWTDDSINQSLAEEFAKCAAFSGIAAGCARKGAQARPDTAAAAEYEEAAKRFYKGSYLLAGQEFTRGRIHSHDTAQRRIAGNACEGFPKLEQQCRKHCDDTAKRLPHKAR